MLPYNQLGILISTTTFKDHYWCVKVHRGQAELQHWYRKWMHVVKGRTNRHASPPPPHMHLFNLNNCLKRTSVKLSDFAQNFFGVEKVQLASFCTSPFVPLSSSSVTWKTDTQETGGIQIPCDFSLFFQVKWSESCSLSLVPQALLSSHLLQQWHHHAAQVIYRACATLCTMCHILVLTQSDDRPLELSLSLYRKCGDTMG